ncbi:MAG: sugar phosphate isomerase/epimerase family protein [Promethearchaeota archaeon]
MKTSNLLKMANLMGFEHVEFDPTVFDDIEATIAIIGNRSVVLHAPFYVWWGYDLSSKNKSEKVEAFMQNVEKYAIQLKAHSMVVHPPVDPEADNEYFIENLNRLSPLTVYLENVPGQKLEDFEKWYLETKSKTTAKVEICFDVPHSFLTHGKDHLFDIPETLIPDINYIHISELSADTDCHWPFGNPGGELPYEKFVEFYKRIKFDGTINMEMMPADLKGIENLIDSYLKLKKLGPKFPYYRKKVRIACLKPLLMNKIKDVPFKAEPDMHLD